MISWLLLAGAIGLTFTSRWWLVAVGVVGIYKSFQLWYHNGRPWRRVHFPAMRAYASAAGREVAESGNQGRGFDVRNALVHLVEMRRQDWDERQIGMFVDRELQAAKSYSDEPLIKAAFRKRYPKASESELNGLIHEVGESIDVNDDSWAVRTVIAGLIEEKYGKEDRGEYLRECVLGNAK